MIKWRNSVFHNHDTVQKRKLLGGVSFDGGAGGGSKTAAPSQAGVQTAQPSFSDVSDQIPGIGLGITGWHAGGSAIGGKGGTSGVGNVGKGKRDTVSIREASMMPISAQEAAWTDKMASVIIPAPEKNSRFLKLKKYVGKLQKGIQAFLQGKERRADKGNGQRHKRKDGSGTRMVRKEDALAAAADYLLESYNRHGERSTLGKQ